MTPSDNTQYNRFMIGGLEWSIKTFRTLLGDPYEL